MKLLVDADNNTGTDGTAALTDSEAEAFLDSDRGDQLNVHLDVITRHAHLGALGQRDNTGNVGRSEVELRTIVVEERGMTAALVLGQDVNLAAELGVRMNGAGLAENLTTLDLVSLNTTEQNTNVVASLSKVQRLAEHLKAGDNGLLALLGEADDLDFLANLRHAALHTTGSNGAAAGNREDVLNRHQEGQIGLTIRSRDIAVNSVHELMDAGILGRIRIGGGGLENLQAGTTNDRGVIARELVLAQEVTDLHLDEIEELLVVDLVDLVHEHLPDGPAGCALWSEAWGRQQQIQPG